MAESLIDTYQFCDDIINQHKNSQFAKEEELLQLVNEFSIHYTDLKQKLPYHINIIDELHVNENANSRILSSFLMYEDRGDYPLLKSFITSCLPNWEIEVQSPIITTEEQRIDFLVREKNKYAIIFENKIYDAILQKNQLARYINKMHSEGFKDKQIYVVFLPPYYYEPDICSWQEHQDCCDSCDRTSCKISQNPKLRELYKERFKVVTFRDDILKWLKDEAYPNCKQREVYLSTAMMQYIDYLEGYFDLRTINKQMNMELKDFLNEKLQLAKLSNEEKLNVLKEKTEEINRLLNQINSIKDDIIEEEDYKLWNSYLPKIQGICSRIASRLNMKSDVKFVNPDTLLSHFYIRFYKDEWELSIVLEKYEPKRNDATFIYIGIPTEKNVDSKFKNINRIFDKNTYPHEYPYGWEPVNKYNVNSIAFKDDIDNGEFESFLNIKIKEIIKAIEEKNLPMS